MLCDEAGVAQFLEAVEEVHDAIGLGRQKAGEGEGDFVVLVLHGVQEGEEESGHDAYDKDESSGDEEEAGVDFAGVSGGIGGRFRRCVLRGGIVGGSRRLITVFGRGGALEEPKRSHNGDDDGKDDFQVS